MSVASLSAQARLILVHADDGTGRCQACREWSPCAHELAGLAVFGEGDLPPEGLADPVMEVVLGPDVASPDAHAEGECDGVGAELR